MSFVYLHDEAKLTEFSLVKLMQMFCQQNLYYPLPYFVALPLFFVLKHPKKLEFLYSYRKE